MPRTPHDPAVCPSCVALYGVLNGLHYLGQLVPFPSYVPATIEWSGILLEGHQEHMRAMDELSTSASSENGVTGVREPVTEDPPDGRTRVG